MMVSERVRSWADQSRIEKQFIAGNWPQEERKIGTKNRGKKNPKNYRWAGNRYNTIYINKLKK